MAIEPPQRRINVRQIQTQKRNVPIDQIIAVQGQNPLATGIEQLGGIVGQTLQRRAELQRQGQELAALSQLAGEDLTGVPPQLANQIALDAYKTRSKPSQRELKPLPGGVVEQDGKTFQPFYVEGTDEIVYKELTGKKQRTPAPLHFAGMTPEGAPISYDPNSGTTSTPSAKNYQGTLLPKTVGTEEQRRMALVGGAKASIDDIKNIVTASPNTLAELKGIRLSPGRVYSQLASPEAKRLYINLREAISNEIYLKTGATANEQELENATISYMVALNDSPRDFLGRMELLERNIMPFNQRTLQPINSQPPGPLKPMTPKRVGRFHVEEE